MPERARLRPLEATLDPGGLLGGWQALNRSATIGHCIARLEVAGNLGNLRRLREADAGPFRGFWFADSDVYKVLEAVGWDGGWDAFADDTVALLRDVQDDDGYLNSWIQGVHPDRRWPQLETSHELYCAGHLIQAAVARPPRRRATPLLAVARRFADLTGGARARPAAIPRSRRRLSSCTGTGEARYLAWPAPVRAARARPARRRSRFGRRYHQDHAPVREARAGRACRAAALPRCRHDRRAPRDRRPLAARRHGGAVAPHVRGEDIRHRRARLAAPRRGVRRSLRAAARPRLRRDLRRDRSFMWSWRLLLATGHGRYADEMERTLYNAVAASTSLDGRHFSYSNPLHLRSGHDGSDEDARRAPAVVQLRVLPAEPRAARRLPAALRRHPRRRRHPAAPARGRPRRERARRADRRDRSTRGTAASRSRSTARRRVDARRVRIPAWCEGRDPRSTASRCPRRPRARLPARCAAVDAGARRARPADAGPGAAAAPAHRRGARLRGAGPRAARLLRGAGRPSPRGAGGGPPPRRAAPPAPAGPNAELGVPVTLAGPATVVAGGPDALYSRRPARSGGSARHADGDPLLPLGEPRTTRCGCGSLRASGRRARAEDQLGRHGRR